MLKREITFTDFFGEQYTDTFYFNLTETELVEFEADHSGEGGVANMLKRIVDTEDPKRLLTEFQRFILMSYGERSEDGRHFQKSDDISARFKSHAAFNALFMELAQDSDKAAEFFLGVLPAKYVQEIQESQPSVIPNGFTPPPPPSAPTTS